MSTTKSQEMVFLPPGAGEMLWVLGDQVTLKADGARDGIGFFEATIAPGGGPPPHVHREQEEVHYVVAGTFSFLGGETWIEAGPGSYIYIPRGVVHTFRNIGSTPGKLISTNNRPGGHDQWFRHVGVPIADLATFTPPANKPDMEEVVRSAAQADIYFVTPEHH